MMHAQVATSFHTTIRSTTLLTILLLALLAPLARAQSLNGPEHPTPLATVTLPSGVTVSIAGLDVQTPYAGAPKVLAVSSYIVTVTPPMGWRFSFDERHGFDGVYRNWDLVFVKSSGQAMRINVDVRAVLESEGIQLVPRSDTTFSAPLSPVVPSADDAEMRRSLWVLAFLGVVALIAIVIIVLGAADPLERFTAGTIMR